MSYLVALAVVVMSKSLILLNNRMPSGSAIMKRGECGGI